MKSQTSVRFRSLLGDLPTSVRKHARDAYRLFENNPQHPSLRFKRVHTTEPVYSARVTQDYRALGVVEGDSIVWFWIGSHANYEALLKRL